MIPLTTVLSGGDRVKEMAVLLRTSNTIDVGGPSGTKVENNWLVIIGN